MNKQPITIRDCGLRDYGEMLEEQKRVLQAVHAGNAQNTVMLVEHNPVITLGARKSENKFTAEQNFIESRGIELYSIRRGGGTTAHNPGQLVIYPIVNLRAIDIGINEFIRELEQIGIEALKAAGVDSRRKKGLPGLWIGEEKIASIGVKVNMGITYHGMAVNIANDLSIFDYIVPCGLEGVRMTSLQKQGKQCPIEVFKREITSVIINRWAK